MSRWLPLLLLAACSGTAADELAPPAADAGADCVEVVDPPHIPNCCRTPELEARFIPTEPVCWHDAEAFEAWRQEYRAAFFSVPVSCKAVHEGEACDFE